MDCVRTVLRMGAERSVMTYRRSYPGDPGRALMRFTKPDIEGVEIQYMVSPNRIIGDANATSSYRADPERARRARCARGRRRPEHGCRLRIHHRVRHGFSSHRPKTGQFLPGRCPSQPRPRRAYRCSIRNLRTELPTVWRPATMSSNPTNFIPRSAKANGCRIDRPADARAPNRRSARWKSPASRPNTSPPTQRPAFRGVAEWSMTAMSRRLVWATTIRVRPPGNAGPAGTLSRDGHG